MVSVSITVSSAFDTSSVSSVASMTDGTTTSASKGFSPSKSESSFVSSVVSGDTSSSVDSLSSDSSKTFDSTTSSLATSWDSVMSSLIETFSTASEEFAGARVGISLSSVLSAFPTTGASSASSGNTSGVSSTSLTICESATSALTSVSAGSAWSATAASTLLGSTVSISASVDFSSSSGSDRTSAVVVCRNSRIRIKFSPAYTCTLIS